MKTREQLTIAPYLDIQGELLPDSIKRVSDIGRTQLADWYSDFGKTIWPHTYGQTPCEFAAIVGYMLTHGGPSVFQRKIAQDSEFSKTNAAIQAYKILITQH